MALKAVTPLVCDLELINEGDNNDNHLSNLSYGSQYTRISYLLARLNDDSPI